MSNRRSRSRRREKIFGINNDVFYAVLIFAILIIVVSLVIIISLDLYEKKKVSEEKERINSEVENIFEDTNKSLESLNDYKTSSLIRFSAVGDILCGNNLKKYTKDYNYIFEDVKGCMKDADFVLGTYETTSTDKNFIQSIKNAGINMVSLAHNHALDDGIEGLNNTKSILENEKIQTIGISSDKVEERVKIVEKKNVKIAVLGYTYDNKKQGVNIFSKDLAKADLDYAKQNANVIIVLMHWGNLNTNTVSKEQESQADFLIKNGANVIIGAHPSAVQKMEIKKNDEGKDCFVAYSLGDFTSDFESENANLELILNFQIYMDKDKNVSIYKVDYTPVYMTDLGVKNENRYKILDMKNEIANYDTENSKIDKRTYDKLVRGLDKLKNIIK